MALNYKETLDNLINELEMRLFDYVSENCHSSDGDGDWVEFEESDEYCMALNDTIDWLKQRREEECY